ncbi:DUF6113 family protein [Streptomyces sp. H27-D2]|uniref:DUF6113 family protein n=1 Tax=Streptomyces sp. H27-D2 TaxID=3046304 RepID=UPI002DB6A647|nr:DUF6113 family protein [Streptomyces sp. H27-D2]MEC4018462.1 DUF6113 family protein [Streptomyces sp. H27-D2]
MALPVPTVNARRVFTYSGLFVLGLLAGFAGTLVQGGWFPGGLLLALVGAGALFIGGGKATETRGGALAPAAGWLVAVMLLMTTRPEGDFLFGVGLGTYVFLFGGMLVGVISATVPTLSPPGP